MQPYRLAVVTASVREGRFGPTVSGWFSLLARGRSDLELSDLDLARLGVEGPALKAAIGAADAVVIVTPEYNHSFPGPLKTAIDSLHVEWFGKPVAFVSYGGISGGIRSAEALRNVLAGVHAVTIRETVTFVRARDAFDSGGEPKDRPAVDAAAHRLLDCLGWWARALRAAREAEPYPIPGWGTSA